MILASVDLETTGLDPDKGCKLIQVGLVIKNPNSDKLDKYVMDVQPVGDIFIESRALGVNKFTLLRIAQADVTSTVDAWFDTQLRKDGYKHDTLIPVGWNVIAFDREFLRREMPLLYKYFQFASPTHSTRAIDLTSLGLLAEYKTGIPYSDIKVAMKNYTRDVLGRENEHDALYDAEAALVALDRFKSWFKGEQ